MVGRAAAVTFSRAALLRTAPPDRQDHSQMSRAETLPSAYPGSIFFQLQAVAVYSMAAVFAWLKARGRGAAPEAAAAAMRTWRLCRSTVAAWVSLSGWRIGSR